MSESFKLIGCYGALPDACAAVDILPPDAPKEYGYTRVKTLKDRHGERSGAVLAMTDGNGYICMNWQLSVQAVCFNDFDSKKKYSKKELAEIKKRLDAARAAERERVRLAQATAAKVARALIRCALQGAAS